MKNEFNIPDPFRAWCHLCQGEQTVSGVEGKGFLTIDELRAHCVDYQSNMSEGCMRFDISVEQEESARELIKAIREYRERAAIRPHEVMRLNMAIQKFEVMFPMIKD